MASERGVGLREDVNSLSLHWGCERWLSSSSSELLERRREPLIPGGNAVPNGIPRVTSLFSEASSAVAACTNHTAVKDSVGSTEFRNVAQG